jgi:hypothetical protein
MNEYKMIFEGLIKRARSSGRANRRTLQPPEFYEILIYQKTSSNGLPQTQSNDAVIPIMSKAASNLQCSVPGRNGQRQLHGLPANHNV